PTGSRVIRAGSLSDHPVDSGDAARPADHTATLRAAGAPTAKEVRLYSLTPCGALTTFFLLNASFSSGTIAHSLETASTFRMIFCQQADAIATKETSAPAPRRRSARRRPAAPPEPA